MFIFYIHSIKDNKVQTTKRQSVNRRLTVLENIIEILKYKFLEAKKMHLNFKLYFEYYSFSVVVIILWKKYAFLRIHTHQYTRSLSDRCFVEVCLAFCLTWSSLEYDFHEFIYFNVLLLTAGSHSVLLETPV